jgi:predicted TIM-barrel fold metal-dependent hydrolase
MIDGNKVFDVNAYLGPWYSRRLAVTTAPGLIPLMDEYGIDRSVVGSLSAVMYRNAQSGNEELAREVEGHRDRLVPFGVVNPDYVAWESDLAWCAGTLGARGIRLYPQYHGYRLSDRCCDEACAACAERGLPVTLLQRQEDYRQSHWMVDARDLLLDDIASLVARHPKTRFILMEGAGYAGSRLVREAASLPKNWWVEISRESVFMDKELVVLLESLGADRLLFGTGMPMKLAGPVMLKMRHLPATPAQKRLIHGGNLAGILGV